MPVRILRSHGAYRLSSGMDLEHGKGASPAQSWDGPLRVLQHRNWGVLGLSGSATRAPQSTNYRERGQIHVCQDPAI